MVRVTLKLRTVKQALGWAWRNVKEALSRAGGKPR
jgi:hypothetical protein